MNIDQLKILLDKEGWNLARGDEDKPVIVAYGQQFPIVHPFSIHSKLYRESTNPETKYLHMKAMHDYLWPHTLDTWHYWTERRFRAHCEGWNYISYAAGANMAKSNDAAKVGILFWLGNPQKRGVLVASVSLDSLNKRIWGYVCKFIREAKIPLNYRYLRDKPPKIIWNSEKVDQSRGKTPDDLKHGMFAIAAKKGDDDTAINTWIGVHPEDMLLLVLDEGTDMPPALMNAFPNLEAKEDKFQCMVIGNSADEFDIHGALSTPKHGWDSVDPMKDIQWETTRRNGICLYFSPYESPAIHETDPQKKAVLSTFLITEEELLSKEKKLGKDSYSYWRFVLGFWQRGSSDLVIISKRFLEDFEVRSRAEWSGLGPLHYCAGLDPAFSTGGDKCILRLGILGQDIHGMTALDFRKEELLFQVPISAIVNKSPELQICDFVLPVLDRFNVPLNRLVVDATGQGRALGELLAQRSNTGLHPLKIYSVKTGDKVKNSFDVIIKTAYELWFALRAFIQGHQIYGIDDVALWQLTTRLIERDLKSKKETLEPKNTYKSRMGAMMPSLARSPDEADGVTLCLQSAILALGFTPGDRREIPVYTPQMEKYRAFMAGKAIEEQKVRNAPPRATFEADITSLVRSSRSSPFGS